jgi:ubiquinone/menaquinone biosynthesis C-methylase UbiE
VNIRGYYDTFSETYEAERHYGYHRWLDEQSVALVAQLASGSHVLEVGCGTGLILREVATVANTAVGLDISHGMLGTCAARDLTVVEASATQIPFADNRFDLVYSFKVLAHVDNIEQALAEMARVTRPGGHLILEFYNRSSLRYLVRRLRPPGSVGPETNESHVFTRFDTVAELKNMLPPSLSLVRTSGLRVATVAPQVFTLPGIGRAWAGFENLLAKTPLRRFGGFLVLVCKKKIPGL